MDELAELDHATQRRLVLQAHKVIKGAEFASADIRHEQVTISEFDASTRNWVVGLSIGAVFSGGLSLLCLFWVLPNHFRVKSLLRAHWREWVRSPDPECAHLVLIEDVRRTLGSLPRALRKQARGAHGELSRVSKTWSDLQARLDRLQAVAAESAVHGLDQRCAEIRERMRRETDDVTLTSLRKLESALDGQLAAARDLALWRGRLTAAQDECTESLRHLRSQLTLLAASGAHADPTALLDTTSSLQELNARLAATHSAAEEVLQLRT